MYTNMSNGGADARYIFITSGSSVTSTWIASISTYPSGDFTFSTKNATPVFCKFYGASTAGLVAGTNAVYFNTANDTALS